MQVVATAGHVDHGKSTLIRALTGMEPDRWAEERRRGLSIDLGFAWMVAGDGRQVAFVDVPGHERFVPNMLAGVGPVPAVMFVVAADEGWMPQSAEHLAAIDALGITRGLLVVTRADLADPGPALREAAERIRGSSLGQVDSLAVSGVTGQGMDELRAALGRLVDGLPAGDPGAPVRLWVDRAFSIRGSGTVVTGTLPAGTIGIHDELLAAPSMRPARVRAIQTLKEPAERVSGVARVAVNLRGVAPAALARGTALVTPGAWALTAAVDLRLAVSAGAARPPRELTLHIGTARTTARVRVLGGAAARLALDRPLPLHVGDRVLLRVPGAAASSPPGSGRPSWPAVTGVPRPPPRASLPPGRRCRARHRCCGGTAWPGAPTCGRWASPRARRRSRGTGWPTRRTGRRWVTGWPGWPPRTPRGTRWHPGCRWTRPAPSSGWPTGGWSRRSPRAGWPARRACCGPRRTCRTGCWPRSGGCARTWPGRRSWHPRRAGSPSSGCPRGNSRPPGGPGCCCG